MTPSCIQEINFLTEFYSDTKPSKIIYERLQKRFHKIMNLPSDMVHKMLTNDTVDLFLTLAVEAGMKQPSYSRPVLLIPDSYRQLYLNGIEGAEDFKKHIVGFRNWGDYMRKNIKLWSSDDISIYSDNNPIIIMPTCTLTQHFTLHVFSSGKHWPYYTSSYVDTVTLRDTSEARLVITGIASLVPPGEVWRTVQSPRHAISVDGVNCGVLICFMSCCLIFGWPIPSQNLTALAYDRLRKVMAESLFNGELIPEEILDASIALDKWECDIFH